MLLGHLALINESLQFTALRARSLTVNKTLKERFGLKTAEFLYFPVKAAKILETKFFMTYDEVYNEYRPISGAVISGSNCDHTPFCPDFLTRTSPLNRSFTHPLLGACKVYHYEDPLALTMPQNAELSVLFDMLWGTFYPSYFDFFNKVVGIVCWHNFTLSRNVLGPST